MHDRYAEGDYEHVGLANVRVAFATGLRMCASTLRMYVDKWTQNKRNASSGSISFQYRITDDIILFIFIAPDPDTSSLLSVLHLCFSSLLFLPQFCHSSLSSFLVNFRHQKCIFCHNLVQVEL